MIFRESTYRPRPPSKYLLGSLVWKLQNVIQTVASIENVLVNLILGMD